jgi:hypothetical protein
VNERQWWSSHVRKYWHNKSKGWSALKVQDAYNGGLFDTINCWEGHVVAIELKWVAKFPARPTTKMLKDQSQGGEGLSPEQRRWLEIWRDGQGLSYVVQGVARDWFLFSLDMVPEEGLTRAEMYDTAVRAGVGYQSLSAVPLYFIANFDACQRTAP